MNEYIEEKNIDIHDRVAEAYNGELGERLMIETQRRLHWICDNIRGKKILDVGCSQGILPILLGREDKKVIGIDISQKAIDEANNALRKENDYVKDNVSFLRTDFLLNNFKDEKYDSIVIAEVLEHLVNPQEFIDKAKNLLVDNGTFIITVPFGINDHIDHKHTYYFLEPYQMLSKYFYLDEVVIMGKWIAFRAIKKENFESDFNRIEYNILEKLEKSFFDVERSLIDKQKIMHEKLEILYEEKKKNKEKYDILIENLDEYKVKNKENINKYINMHQKLEKLYEEKKKNKEKYNALGEKFNNYKIISQENYQNKINKQKEMHEKLEILYEEKKKNKEKYDNLVEKFNFYKKNN